MKRVLLALILALPAPFAWAQSQVPTLISYSGKVVDASGNGITATRTVTFRIWDNATATAAVNRLFSEQQSVTISGGEFSVLIGAGSAVSGEANAAGITSVADAFAGSNRFLGVTVDDGTSAVDPEMSPRQQIVTTAFAFRAKVAESVAGGSVTTAMIANTAVNTTQLADEAVSTTKIADNAVRASKILDGTITTAKIADGAITSAKLAFPIDASKLAANSVGSGQIAGNSIDSARIVDGSVSLADLAPNSVDTGKIVTGAVGMMQIAYGAVNFDRIADGNVTLPKMAANSVDSSKIVDGSIGLADLNTTIRDGLPKQRHIYNQAVNPDVDPRGYTLFPLDLGDLGNDPDGCVLHYFGWVKNNGGGDSRIGEIRFNLQQPGFINDPNYSNIINVVAAHHAMNVGNTGAHGWGTVNFKLNAAPGAGGMLENHAIDSWCRMFNFYPGSLAAGLPAPFNQNQESTANNANAGGPPVTFNVVSVVTGDGKLTITVNNPHAIQVGDSLILASMTGTGTPTANGTRIVTAQTDRTSFEVALAGATGTYTGGTVTHQPKWNKFRIWVAVHPTVSLRFIVSDR